MTKEKLQDLLEVNELSLSENESKNVLSIFDCLNESEKAMTCVDTENIDIMVHVQPMTNVLREDVREQKFSRESLLEGAPEHTDDSWQVPILVK